MMKQTLPIINKPKQPTKLKEKYKEQKGRTHIQEEDKKNHLRGWILEEGSQKAAHT